MASLALGLFALSVAAATRASNGDPRGEPVALTWDADSACPNVDVIHERMRRLLSGMVDAHPPITASAVVRLVGNHFTLHLSTAQGPLRGEKRLVAEECSELANGTALILAMMIDPERAMRGASALAGTTSAPAAASAAASTASPGMSMPVPSAYRAPVPRIRSQPTAVVAPTARVPIEASVAAGAAFMGLTLPKASAGLGIGASLAYAPWHFEADFAWYGRQHAFADASPAAGGTMGYQAMSARACYVHSVGPVRLGPCAGAEFGWFSTQGTGVSDPASPWAATFGPRVDGLVALRLAPWASLIGRMALTVLPVRPRFGVEPYGNVHEVPALGVRGNLFLAVHFL